MSKQWKFLNKKIVYAHPYRSVEEWTFTIPDGSEHTYSVQVAADVVIVFGITKGKQVLLLHQYYVAQGVKVPTLVAGFVDTVDPEDTAKHELREEAGCEAKEFIYLGSSYKGKYATGVFHFYLARDIELVGPQELEPSEDIDASLISLDQCRELLRTSALQDVAQVACAYRALDYLGYL